MTFFPFRRARASMIAEVLVSLFILSAGISAGASLITSAIHANVLNKNRLIATNLAREGIEAVRIIRDTNWLQNGEKIRACWNFWEDTKEDGIIDENDSECEPNKNGQNDHPIGKTSDGTKIQNYIAVLNPDNFHWYLAENFFLREENGNERQTHEENLNNDDPTKWATRAETMQVNTNPSALNRVGVNSRLYLTSEGLYTHISDGNTETQFYREIRISYPLGENGFFPDEEETGASLDNQILVTSTVWYNYKGSFKRVALQTELTDYLNRDNWLE
jgi:type II secretory pathway pseudopilin PulG